MTSMKFYPQMNTWECVVEGKHKRVNFWECLQDCHLVDLGFSGPKYTWNNRQQGQDNIRVRLDRAVANGQFLQFFGDAHVDNIITTSSDHHAALLSLKKQRKVIKEMPSTIISDIKQLGVELLTTMKWWRNHGL
jgi:hypothetical protein